MKKKVKKLTALGMAGILAASGLSMCTLKAKAGEKEGIARYASPVKAEKPTEGFVIGNQYITRSFSTGGQKLTTEKISNLRANLEFVPAANSEEFIISLRKSAVDAPAAIDRSGWVATASDQNSDTPGPGDGPGSNMIDDSETTYWHSKYKGEAVGYPHHLIIDMQKETTISALSYLPRQESDNGQIGEYAVYIGNSEADLEKEENLAGKGTFLYDGRNRIFANLNQTMTGRYVKFKALSPNISGQKWATGADLQFYKDKIEGITDDGRNAIKASDLTLLPEKIQTYRTENGIQAEFPFETYAKNGVNWDITMKIVMEDGDHFMRKFLEIKADKPDQAVIDYIDLESMNVEEGNATWTHPEMDAGVGGMSGYVISLGQPVYLQGMFFGCEFPMTETEIDTNKNAHMRYYSGKSFTKLKEDNQLTVDGKYVTWQTVAGAARSTDINVIQSDFYEYIDSISTPTEFRTQYNSWYDNMMNINDENIDSAFTRMEKGFSESGVKPIDSYVVDDGWNNYNSEKYNVNDQSKCGTTKNETGFWEFNNKFPQGFAPSQKLAKNFSSGFGVWLGPRGGYNFNGQMGHIIEDAGFGAYNAASGDIDVGDRRYVKKLTGFFCDMQDTYGINYWKLDGFATKACGNKEHHHMTGGKNGMYYFSDTWEAWIDLIETLRNNAEKNKIKNLWFNLTCYVNPSPWYLQWANSIWMQNSQDMGRVKAGQSSQVDQLLSYRDGRYFDFVKERQFQFPLNNMYNHDPIYGKTGTNLAGQMTDEEFQTYLYMMATRGTAFWEFYYSPEMIDEGQKWAVNAEFLEWAKKNHNILRNAKLLGTTPDKGNTYGYSCWYQEDGIISMRNPSDTVKELNFTLDRNIGVSESLQGKTLYRTTLLQHKTSDGQKEYQTVKYGDTIKVTLEPGEARIWSLSTSRDTKAPQLVAAKAVNDKTIAVTFDERMSLTDAATVLDGYKVENTELRADYRTVNVTLNRSLETGKQVQLTLKNMGDIAGNKAEYKVPVTYYTDGTAAAVNGKADLKGADAVSEQNESALANKKTVHIKNAQYDLNTTAAVTGESDFAVETYLFTTGTGTVVQQENGYSLSVNADGKLVFTVGKESAVSSQKVNDGTWKHVAGLREKNGILKVYVNGVLDGSFYDEKTQKVRLEAGQICIGDTGAEFRLAECKVRNQTLSLTQLKNAGNVVPNVQAGQGKEPDKDGRFTVTFHTNGGSAVNEVKAKAGDNWTLPGAPSREGYEFAGWFSNVNLTQEYKAAVPLTTNIYLYAKWNKIEKTPLESAKEGAESIIANLLNLKKDAYTQESWAELENAILAVKNAATVEDVQSALQILELAKKNLKQRDGSETTDPIVQPPSGNTPVVQPPQVEAQQLGTPVIASVRSSYKGITVKWSSVAGAASYEVKRNGAVIANTAKTSILDTKAKSGAVYMVTAKGDGTKYKDSISSTKKCPALPKKTSILKAVKNTGAVTLKWKKIKGATGYVVLRASSLKGAYRKVKAVKGISYTDKKAKGKKAYYKVVVRKKNTYSMTSKVKKVILK